MLCGSRALGRRVPTPLRPPPPRMSRTLGATCSLRRCRGSRAQLRTDRPDGIGANASLVVSRHYHLPRSTTTSSRSWLDVSVLGTFGAPVHDLRWRRPPPYPAKESAIADVSPLQLWHFAWSPAVRRPPTSCACSINDHVLGTPERPALTVPSHTHTHGRRSGGSGRRRSLLGVTDVFGLPGVTFSPSFPRRPRSIYTWLRSARVREILLPCVVHRLRINAGALRDSLMPSPL